MKAHKICLRMYAVYQYCFLYKLICIASDLKGYCAPDTLLKRTYENSFFFVNNRINYQTKYLTLNLIMIRFSHIFLVETACLKARNIPILLHVFIPKTKCLYTISITCFNAHQITFTQI